MVALLVDDQAESRTLLARVLTRSGWAVRHANDGAEALELALKDPPDIVITDLDMPVMDGVTLCRRLRSEPATMHLPLVAVTGGEFGDEALSAGCDVVLEKPFAPHAVIEVVQRLVARRS